MSICKSLQFLGSGIIDTNVYVTTTRFSLTPSILLLRGYGPANAITITVKPDDVAFAATKS